MEVVLLRFDAPMMSFGGVVVDQRNTTDLFPYRAMLTGLIANALGWNRSDASSHDALQARLRYAARLDRSGTLMMDYQTVDFSDDGTMSDKLAWTSWGVLEERRGGGASDGTHIRFRQYLADAILTVAIALEAPSESPGIDAVARALAEPARPLFLGRKCCLPASPVFLRRTTAASLLEAITLEPRVEPFRAGGPRRGEWAEPLPAVWPAGDGRDEARSELWPRVEDRDWGNSIHVGRRILVTGLVNPPQLPSRNIVQNEEDSP